MNIALWIIQGLLAFVFLMAGMMKIIQPKEKLYKRGMEFVEDYSQSIIHGIGILEVLGGIGIILPTLTGILPWLTPLAAVGLVLTMIGAALTHLRRKEYDRVPMNVILFSLAAFTAYGRFMLVPLS